MPLHHLCHTLHSKWVALILKYHQPTCCMANGHSGLFHVCLICVSHLVVHVSWPMAVVLCRVSTLLIGYPTADGHSTRGVCLVCISVPYLSVPVSLVAMVVTNILCCVFSWCCAIGTYRASAVLHICFTFICIISLSAWQWLLWVWLIVMALSFLLCWACQVCNDGPLWGLWS